ARIICSGVIWPSSACCILVGQTVLVKSAVLEESGSTPAIGSDAVEAATNRASCWVSSLAPEVVTDNWPVSLTKSALFWPVERKLIHLNAAALSLAPAKTALD